MTGPSSIALPTVGDGLTWRPVTAAYTGLVLDLKRAAGRIDHPRSLITRDELEEEFGSAAFTPENDAVIATDSAGRAVAYGSAVAPTSQETIVWVDLDGTVAPDRRGEGIGRALLAWQEARGLQHLAACDAACPDGSPRVPTTMPPLRSGSWRHTATNAPGGGWSWNATSPRQPPSRRPSPGCGSFPMPRKGRNEPDPR
ncbi:hypothetical protein GCM10010207_87210 [Streptomyces atratus]|nr:hypothetical protein GCM10010207_87210 [Streptomyces atratus]